jgi:hypothetical protein
MMMVSWIFWWIPKTASRLLKLSHQILRVWRMGLKTLDGINKRWKKYFRTGR